MTMFTPLALQLVDILGFPLEANSGKLRGEHTLRLKAGESLMLPIHVRVWDSKIEANMAAVVLRTKGELGLALSVLTTGEAELVILDYAKAESIDRKSDGVLKSTQLSKLEDVQGAFMPMVVAAYRSPSPGKPWVEASIGVASLL